MRACVQKPSTLINFDEITRIPQLERLWAIRNVNLPNFSAFIDWLEKALVEGVPVREIRECVDEFFALPSLKDDLALPETSQDPYGAYSREKAMQKAWELLKSTPAELQHALVYRLPLRVGRHGKITAEQLATLPPEILERLFYLTVEDGSYELEKLKDMVRTQPDKFDAEIVKALQREDNELSDPPSREEVRNWRLLARNDPARATLEMLSTIMERFDTLEQRLGDIESAQKAKKGFFG